MHIKYLWIVILGLSLNVVTPVIYAASADESVETIKKKSSKLKKIKEEININNQNTLLIGAFLALLVVVVLSKKQDVIEQGVPAVSVPEVMQAPVVSVVPELIKAPVVQAQIEAVATAATPSFVALFNRFSEALYTSLS